MHAKSQLNYILFFAFSFLIFQTDLLFGQEAQWEVAARSILAKVQKEPLTPNAWKALERTTDFELALPAFLDLVDEIDKVDVGIRKSLTSLESMQHHLNKWDRGRLACLIELSCLHDLFDPNLPIVDSSAMDNITAGAIEIIDKYLLDSLPPIPKGIFSDVNSVEEIKLRQAIASARKATRLDLSVQSVRQGLYWIQKNTKNQLSQSLLSQASPKVLRTIAEDLAVPSVNLLSDQLLDEHRKKFKAQVSDIITPDSVIEPKKAQGVQIQQRPGNSAVKPSDQVEGVFYAVADAKDPGHPLEDQTIDSAILKSITNDNSRYLLTLHRTTPFLPTSHWVTLLIHGEILWTIPDNASTTRHKLCFTVHKDLIKDLIVKFHPVIEERQHPGHQWTTVFVPDKHAFSIGDPVKCKLKITNVGKCPFTFESRGIQNARDNAFAFTAVSMDSGKMLQDNGTRGTGEMGGMINYITLNPGESHEIPFDLSNWFDFKISGYYLLRGSFKTELAKQDKSTRFDDTIWDDYVSGEFWITVTL